MSKPEKIDMIEAELWDHYSGLPNPAWYQYKKENEDYEEVDISDGAGDITN